MSSILIICVFAGAHGSALLLVARHLHFCQTFQQQMLCFSIGQLHTHSLLANQVFWQLSIFIHISNPPCIRCFSSFGFVAWHADVKKQASTPIQYCKLRTELCDEFMCCVVKKLILGSYIIEHLATCGMTPAFKIYRPKG